MAVVVAAGLHLNKFAAFAMQMVGVASEYNRFYIQLANIFMNTPFVYVWELRNILVFLVYNAFGMLLHTVCASYY